MTIRRVRHIVLFLLAVFVVIVCIAAFFSSKWKVTSLSEKVQEINPDWEISTPSLIAPEGTIALQRTFSLEDLEATDGGPTVFFRTKNASVLVEVNGNYVYSYGRLGKQFVGSEPGAALHFLRLSRFYPAESFTVNIEFSPAFQPTEHGLFRHGAQRLITPKIYFGSKAACQQAYLKSCLLPALASLIIILLGGMYLLLTGTFWVFQKEYARHFCYWGIFSFIVGFGFFFESGMADVFIYSAFARYFLSTLMLAILPEFFLMYVQTSKLLPSYPRLSNFFIVQSIVNSFIVCICAFIPSLPFSYVRNYIIICHAIYLFFVIAIFLNDFVGLSKRPSIVFILVILTSVSLLIDFTLYLVPPYREDLFSLSRYTMLAYLLLRTIEAINEFYSTQILSAREEMYRTVIVRDTLTSVLTRPAFWRFQKDFFAKNTTINNRLTLILCEITNLKEINETDGFENGDEVLKTVSQILRLHFERQNVYRLDGSCFGVILIDIPNDVVLQNIEEIKKTMEDYNSASDLGTISLSISSGIFNTSQNKSFDTFLTQLQKELSEQRQQYVSKIK